jgi:hypothetical protein
MAAAASSRTLSYDGRRSMRVLSVVPPSRATVRSAVPDPATYADEAWEDVEEGEGDERWGDDDPAGGPFARVARTPSMRRLPQPAVGAQPPSLGTASAGSAGGRRYTPSAGVGGSPRAAAGPLPVGELHYEYRYVGTQRLAIPVMPGRQGGGGGGGLYGGGGRFAY